MKRTLQHARHNAVAYVALFVALGGTSYAAINLPANSVGTKQLRNGAVTPRKLDGNAIAGTVRMWARIGADGSVIASKPRAQTIGWNSVDHAGKITWGRAIPVQCFSLATVDGLGTPGFASVATLNQPPPPNYVVVGTFNAAGQPAGESVNVAVICP
jgi:hypothetical protein